MENETISGNPMSNKPLNILKASLPFIPPNMQRGISYYIKIEEFNHMVRGFQEDNLSGLKACGIDTAPKRNFNLNEYLTAITPYLSKAEQDIIKMVLNVVQAMKVYNVYKELDPSFMTGMSAPTSEAEPSYNQNNATETSEYNFNAAEAGSPESSTYSSESDEQSDASDNTGDVSPDHPAAAENQGLNIEALKNMLSPSQKAMFETYSSLLNGNTAV